MDYTTLIDFTRSCLALIGSALTACAAVYACGTAAAVWQGRRGLKSASRSQGTLSAGVALGASPVTVLKPLCGMEIGLYENLRTFCLQEYPHFQLLCGVRDEQDPAIDVVRRLQAEFPAVDLRLVIDPRVHGANLKVSNLANLVPQIAHEVIVIADSDITVPPDYLARLAAQLADSRVGLVTCLYRGTPRAGVWSQLGALFIDDWFVPSVQVSRALGSTRFAFGATMALRREVLESVGGFGAINDVLADDFWLGELVRQQGLQTVLSDVEVGTDVIDSSLAELWSHELRWFRTIRTIEPGGFAFLFVTFTVPILATGLALCHNPWSLAIAAAGLVARMVVQLVRAPRRPWRAAAVDLALLPLRDVLSLAGWMAAYGGSRVRWREQVFDGLASREPTPVPGR